MSDEQKTITPQEYFKDFPEAPFSDTFKWLDLDGFEHMVTIRSWSSNSGIQAVNKAKDEIKAIGGIAPANKQLPQAPAPKPDPAAKIAMDAGNKVLAAEIQAQGEAVPPSSNGQEWNTVEVNEIRIEPKADGMVSVEFWNGRTYAEEYVKWKPENVFGLLKHIMAVPTNDDGSIKAAKLLCNCRVYYTLGKEKTGPKAKPGSRWHDVAHVRPL